MLDWMFICLFAFAVILFIMLILFEDKVQIQWRMGLVVFSMALWWSLAAANFEIEIPYQIFNNTSGNIETGYQIFNSKSSPAITYIFSAVAVIMFFYLNYLMYTVVKVLWKKYF